MTNSENTFFTFDI